MRYWDIVVKRSEHRIPNHFETLRRSVFGCFLPAKYRSCSLVFFMFGIPMMSKIAFILVCVDLYYVTWMRNISMLSKAMNADIALFLSADADNKEWPLRCPNCRWYHCSRNCLDVYVALTSENWAEQWLKTSGIYDTCAYIRFTGDKEIIIICVLLHKYYTYR